MPFISVNRQSETCNGITLYYFFRRRALARHVSNVAQQRLDELSSGILSVQCESLHLESDRLIGALR